MNQEQQFTKQLLIRYFTYTVAILGSLATLPFLLRARGLALFQENGPIEWLQFSILIATSLMLTYGAIVEKPMRGLFSVLGAICSIAAMRELDNILDKAIPVLGWRAPGLVILGVIVFMVYHHRHTLFDQINFFVKTAPFGILWTGCVLVVLLAQLLGHGHFLEAVMGDDYSHRYKRVIEEIFELFGYIIILISAIEAIAFDSAMRRKAALTAAKLQTAENEQELVQIH